MRSTKSTGAIRHNDSGVPPMVGICLCFSTVDLAGVGCKYGAVVLKIQWMKLDQTYCPHMTFNSCNECVWSITNAVC